MVKFLVLIIISTFLLSGCHGCSFVKERFGRTYKVKLTKKFFEYFDLPSDEAKQAFLKHVSPELLHDAEQVSKEADEVERLIDLEQKETLGKEEIKTAVDQLKKEE